MRECCWLTGKSVTFRSNGRPCEGVVRGLGDEGDLLVETEKGVQPFQQAELIRVIDAEGSFNS
jgi:biotin-(acetyl-CoA carboxylase) ligase